MATTNDTVIQHFMHRPELTEMGEHMLVTVVFEATGGRSQSGGRTEPCNCPASSRVVSAR